MTVLVSSISLSQLSHLWSGFVDFFPYYILCFILCTIGYVLVSDNERCTVLRIVSIGAKRRHKSFCGQGLNKTESDDSNLKGRDCEVGKVTPRLLDLMEKQRNDNMFMFDSLIIENL